MNQSAVIHNKVPIHIRVKSAEPTDFDCMGGGGGPDSPPTGDGGERRISHVEFPCQTFLRSLEISGHQRCLAVASTLSQSTTCRLWELSVYGKGGVSGVMAIVQQLLKVYGCI